MVARNYHLRYDGLFDFDVKMRVELTQIANKYLPAKIDYSADNGKFPTKKREVVEVWD